MTTNLNNLKVTELKEMAKELKIKNWWTLKKADLIQAINWEQGILTKHTVEGTETIDTTEEVEVIDITDTEETPIPQEEPKAEEPQGEPQEEADEKDIITLKEIILELGVKGTKARRILRNSDIQRPYKRWEWSTELHQDIIDEVYELLSK